MARYSHPNKDLIKGHNSFKNQFLYYLSTAQNISSFRYYFKARTGVNEATIKEEFKQLFLKKDNEGDYIIFENMFLNKILVNSLGLRIDTEANTLADYLSLVNNIESNFYSFIKTL